jgi:hypothetical protein
MRWRDLWLRGDRSRLFDDWRCGNLSDDGFCGG